MKLPNFIIFPRKVRINAILPEGVDAASLIGEPLKDKTGKMIGKIVAVEDESTLVCRVLTEHAKKIDGSSIPFALKKKS